MEIKQVSTIITITVVIVCVAAILVPVVNDAQVNAGDETTLTNDSSVVLREVESGDVLKCTSTYADSAVTNVWTLNDETVTNTTGSSVTWNAGIISDGYYLQLLSGNSANMAVAYSMADSTATAAYLAGATSTYNSRTLTITFGDSSISRAYYDGSTTSTSSYDYTWAYTVCPYDDGEYCCAVSGGTGIVDSASDVLLCGAYTSGELDTMYYYKDGTSYVSNTDYTMTPSITTELHSGTTDIYDATVSVSMTDGTDTESFTPYRIFVPYEVTGHATSGGYYSLLGAIPVMVIVGLLVTTIGMMAIRRD